MHKSSELSELPALSELSEPSVGLVWSTPNIETIIGYMARVSNPETTQEDDASKLLAYCIKHKHWSIFEMGYVCFRIETTRAIAAQLLRHKSFSFQEYSQRYSSANAYAVVNARKQALKNRQSSTDDLPYDTQAWFTYKQDDLAHQAFAAYDVALEKGIARESARFLLPLSTVTTLYMVGSVRSWIHYVQLRDQDDVQLEHRQITIAIKSLLCVQLPNIAEVLGWDSQASKQASKQASNRSITDE